VQQEKGYRSSRFSGLKGRFNQPKAELSAALRFGKQDDNRPYRGRSIFRALVAGSSLLNSRGLAPAIVENKVVIPKPRGACPLEFNELQTTSVDNKLQKLSWE
jgi:hypothetical protein